MSLAIEARQFLRSTRSGMLCTHSIKMPGYPYGSVAPFVLDHDAQPIVLISTLAEHTKNLLANPKLSLLAIAGTDTNGQHDMQAGARLTLVGEAYEIDKAGTDEQHMRARYLRYLPQAVSYFDMHDFSFYRMRILQARYIAGFGKMSWIAGEEFSGSALLPQPSQLASQEAGIIEHMNADHVDSMLAYCQHVYGIHAHHAEMVGMDSDGFDVRIRVNASVESSAAEINADAVQGSILRFSFEQPVVDAMSARMALVAMSKASRS